MKRPRIAKMILKRSNREHIQPDLRLIIKLYYLRQGGIGIKIKYVDQWNRIKRPKIGLYIYIYRLIDFYKDTSIIYNGERIVFLINGVQTIGYP